MKFVLIASFLISLNARATSYCYDDGLFVWKIAWLHPSHFFTKGVRLMD